MNNERYLKIQSLESGDFSPSNNIVTFDLPQSGTYDLSQSYITLNVYPNITPFDVGGTGAGNAGLVPYFITHQKLQEGGNNYKGINGTIIRNSRLVSDRLGRLEDIRNSNIIFNELWYYTTSQAEKESYGYFLTNPMISPDNILNPQMCDLVKEGTEMTDLSKPFEFQVPIKEFLQLGNLKQFPTDKMGKVRMQVELDVQNLFPVPYMVSPDQDLGGDNDLSFGGRQKRIMENIGQNVDEITGLTTSLPLGIDLSASPYFVGQAITVSATGVSLDEGVTPAPDDIDANSAVITAITVSQSNDDLQYRLQISLSNSVGATGENQGYQDVIIQGLNQNEEYFNGFSFSDAELRLKQVPDVKVDELSYLTFSNESDNANGLAQFNKQYFLEPEAVGVMAIPANNKLRSVGSAITSYRMQIDQGDVFGNRDITTNKMVSIEQLNKLFINVGLPLKDTRLYATPTQGSYFQTNNLAFNTAPNNLAFIGSPTPITQNRKIMDLEITAAGAGDLSSIELFKFLVKGVKL